MSIDSFRMAYAYIDTLKFYTDIYPGDQVTRKLRHLHPKAIMGEPGDPLVRMWWGWSVEIKRPTYGTLHYLSGSIWMPYTFGQVDMAIDWVTNTEVSKRQLRAMLEHQITMPWRRKVGITKIGRTTYFNDRGSRRNIVIYDDKPSRMSGDPFCVHLEHRYELADAVRSKRYDQGRRGIETFDDLMTLDYVQYWRENIRLREIDVATTYRNYERIIFGKSRRRRKSDLTPLAKGRVYDRDRARGNAMLRMMHVGILERRQEASKRLLEEFKRREKKQKRGRKISALIDVEDDSVPITQEYLDEAEVLAVAPVGSSGTHLPPQARHIKDSIILSRRDPEWLLHPLTTVNTWR